MQIQVKSSHGITLVPLETKLLDERKVFIEGVITQESACEFTKKIMYLNAIDPDSPIECFISSTGGEIPSGLQMYDVLQSSHAPIRTYCLGEAYSMGAVLFASGVHGRYILPHSEVMIHEAMIDSSLSGKASSVRIAAENLLASQNLINSILAKHTGKTLAEVGQAASYDHFFTADECIAFGLADKIISFAEIP